MPRGNQEISFTGGLNFDTNVNLIPEGDYRHMLNMRNSKTTNGNWGAVCNAKGNILVPYELPDGENKCIMTLEDRENGTVVYGIWNSDGQHQLLEYYPSEGKIQKVLSGEFLGFDKDRLITQSSIINGTLIQYTDCKEVDGEIQGTRQRYIDKKRALLHNKKCEFDIIAKASTVNKLGTQYSAKIYKDGVVVSNTILVASNPSTGGKNDLYAKLSGALNTELSQYLTADDCGGCKLDVVFKNEGDFWIEINATNGESFFILPRNRYHKDLTQENINLARRPPLYPPAVDPKIDSEFGFNFISGKYFQFAARYVFWDGQKSTVSPFSVIAASPLKCYESESPYNVIEVDYSSEMLQTEKDLSDIKYVEILVREAAFTGGESVVSSFRSVEKIYTCDIPYPNQKFLFKNDGSYPVVSDDETYKPHDFIPIKSLAHDVVDDRGYWANNLENYPNIDCVDASVGVAYEPLEECNQEFITIRCKLRIVNDIKIQINIGGMLNKDAF